MSTQRDRGWAAVLVAAILVALAVAKVSAPNRLAAQEQLQKSERAGSPETGAANPVPLINQPLVPDAVAPGGADFTLTVNGTGFVSASVVNWNGSALATTFVSDSQLTAMVPAADIATDSTGSVAVVSPGPGGGTSNVAFFSITTSSSGLMFSGSDLGSGGYGADAIATGDLNGDGNEDVVAANDLGSNVGVLVGNGDGTFQPEVSYATDPFPDSVVVGDFNGDGRLDLAVRSQFLFTISVLLGNSDGTFQPYITTPTTACQGRLAGADFNGDGKLDLACTSSSANNVAILLGNGDGTFKSEVDYAAGNGADALDVGDFNRDGDIDLVVTDTLAPGGVSVLLGNGDGTFQAAVEYATANLPADSVNAADLNGDGILDLVVPTQNSAVSIFLGNGNGTFSSPVSYPGGGSGARSTVADLNGDGKVDLAITPRTYSDTLSILLGNGDGTFQAPRTSATGTLPLGIVAADFNRDGRLDLAVADNGASTVSVLLQVTNVELSTTSLSFPRQLVGTSSTPETVTLTNRGPITLAILSIQASGDFLQMNTCGSTLVVGATCTIGVSFKPGQRGTRTGTLTITDNATDSPQTVSLTGVGTVVELSPAVLNFGPKEVGTTTQPRIVTVTNTGSTTLSISGIGIGGRDFGDFSEVSACGSSLPAGASCTIKVRFSPKAQGQRQASLDITDNGGGGSQEVRLGGTGT